MTILVGLSPADGYHGSRGSHKARLVDAVSLFLLRDDGVNFVADLAIGRVASQEGPQIVVLLAEQARPELTIGGQAQARTMSAEGLRDGRDQSDFAAAIGKPE